MLQFFCTRKKFVARVPGISEFQDLIKKNWKNTFFSSIPLYWCILSEISIKRSIIGGCSKKSGLFDRRVILLPIVFFQKWLFLKVLYREFLYQKKMAIFENFRISRFDQKKLKKHVFFKHPPILMHFKWNFNKTQYYRRMLEKKWPFWSKSHTTTYCFFPKMTIFEGFSTKWNLRKNWRIF